ncbi:MAG: alpha/beta fold hydrolase [Caulobacterales bacterium]
MGDVLEPDLEALIVRLVRPKRRAVPGLADAFRDADVITLQTAGGDVRAWRIGEGPAVLLVHGWEDDHTLWAPMIAALMKQDHAVVAFDLPGHGQSPESDVTQFTASIAVRAVAEQLGPISAIVAHSFGCAAAAWALAQGLDVDRVVMISSPAPRGEGRGRRYVDRGEVTEELFQRAVGLYETRTGSRFGGFDFYAVAPKLNAKALFIHSSDDDQCPIGRAEQVAALWPGAIFKTTNGLGHRRIAQAPETIDWTTAFLDPI